MANGFYQPPWQQVYGPIQSWWDQQAAASAQRQTNRRERSAPGGGGLMDALRNFWINHRGAGWQGLQQQMNPMTMTMDQPSLGVQNQNNPYTGPNVAMPGMPNVFVHPETANLALAGQGRPTDAFGKGPMMPRPVPGRASYLMNGRYKMNPAMQQGYAYTGR